MTPLVPVTVVGGYVAIGALLRPALRATPGRVAVALWSTLGSGLATALAAGLLVERPDPVGLVARSALALGAAAVAVRVAGRRAGGGSNGAPGERSRRSPARWCRGHARR